MENIFTHILIAFTTFVVTNIDDLLLLSIYFAHPQKYQPKNIVLGQYLGVFLLVAVSLTGMLIGELINTEWLRFLGLVPLGLGLKDLYSYFKNRNRKESEDQDPAEENSSAFIKIAIVTIANGGDNIGVYTPLFAVTPIPYIHLYLIVFFLLIGIWCLLGKYLVSHPKLKSVFNRYGKIILPVFLILLGLTILF